MDANAAGAAPLPPHVDPRRVVEYDMFKVKALDGEYQLGVKRYSQSDIPDIFWTQSNGGHWVFTKTADIEFALSNPDIFSANKMFVPREKNPNPPLTPLMIDPPDHGKYRAMLTPAFTPKAVETLSDGARVRAIELIEGFKAKGGCEFVSEFAERLPIDVFMNMMGLPMEDREHLLEIGEHHVRPPTPQHHIDSMVNLQKYALGKIAERRAKRGDDLISKLIDSKFDGQPLDDNALCGIVVLLLVAGLDTVAAQLGFLARFLAENPKHRKQLVDNPSLIPNATEELLRRYSMVTVGRIAVKDHEIRGVQIKAGDMIIMPTIFVSFDEDRFKNPVEVDFLRDHIFHANFGMGVHRCIGAMLARAELKIFIEEWLKRIPDFRVKPGAEIEINTGTVSGLRRLPLEWNVR